MIYTVNLVEFLILVMGWTLSFILIIFLSRKVNRKEEILFLSLLMTLFAYSLGLLVRGMTLAEIFNIF